MAVAANPEAAEAGCEVLAHGGSAVDAAIAIQASLTVVEPQSSGFGGGALLTYYDSESSTTKVFDGLAAADSVTTPSLKTPTRKEKRSHNIDESSDAVKQSSRAIGVPGVVAALDMAHKQYGKESWNRLFDSAIAQASSGFSITPGTADVLVNSTPIPTCSYPDISAVYCDEASPKTADATITNPELAKLLKEIRDGGSDAFYDPDGTIAPRIGARLQSGRFDAADDDGDPSVIPGLLDRGDFAKYRALERKPLCKQVLGSRLCTNTGPFTRGHFTAQPVADRRG